MIEASLSAEAAECPASEYLFEAESFLRTLASLLYKELTQEQIDALADHDFMAMRDQAENPVLAEGFYGLGRYLKRCGVNVRQDFGGGVCAHLLGCRCAGWHRGYAVRERVHVARRPADAGCA